MNVYALPVSASANVTLMSDRPTAETAKGTPVHVDFRKWGDLEHWQEHVHYLGEDEHGIWLARPTGTVMAKPTFSGTLTYPHVMIITESGWSANICAPLHDSDRVVVYSDMISKPTWHRTTAGLRVTMTDLDLDVMEFGDGRVEVDDEDEFADHQIAWNYPRETVQFAEAARDQVLELLQNKREPFDRVAATWLEKVPDPVADR